MEAAELIVFGFVLAGFIVQGATGFGGGIVALSLGALVMPLDQMLPAFVPLAFAIAVAITIQRWRDVDKAVLMRRVIPVVLPSAAFGLVLFAEFDVKTLLPFFGGLAVLLSVIELLRTLGPPTTRPVHPVASLLLLGAGGIAHGMFASGGPLIVLSLSRLVEDKRAFRATISAMWVILNTVLVSTYIYRGLISMASLRLTGLYFPALLVGLWIGERVLRLLPEVWFSRVVLLIVAGAGSALVLKTVIAS